MGRIRISPLIVGIILFVGIFSIIPNSFGGVGDDDQDGIPNDIDNCPFTTNPLQEDTDGNGIGDACNDADDADGDEHENLLDNCPDNSNPGQEDVDEDGLGDVCDAFPNDPNNDADGDGISGDIDNCPDNSNPGQEDVDEDGLGDVCDAFPNDPNNDADGDGISGDIDNCPNDSNAGQEDVDEDGLGDVCDAFPNDPNNDADGDGISGDIDNCPNDSNAGQENIDNDRLGDVCDAFPNDPRNDADGDGISGDIDNCPFISNPLQEDVIPEGGNGRGDACDAARLLVLATFPPGDTIKVELSEDDAAELLSISLELPDEDSCFDEFGTPVSCDVVIEITDAGATEEADFSFLGEIIDFTAPCTNDCEISFTFTQELLDEQDLALNEVTIFHDGSFDGVHNGSFEENEAIPTEVIDNGDGTFTATATASFTSKFSVGGIKALALGALGGGGFKGGSAPSLENIAFDGVRTVNADGTIGFGGLLIDEIESVNNFPTQTIETGVPFELRLPFYEDNGIGAIEHVAVYVLHEGDKTVYDSELYIIFDRFKPLQSFDSNGYISDFSVNIIEKSSREIDMIFEMVFVLPMEESDVIVRSWDKFKRSSDYKFNNLIKVIESDSISEIIESADTTFSNSQTFGNSDLDSSTLLIPDLQNPNANNALKKHSENIPIEIPLWIKYNANWWSQEEIADDDFIAGIKYLIENNVIQIPEFHQDQPGVKEIPSWIRYNAEWWAGDLVSDAEFVGSIQWLIENGVMDI